MRVIYIDSEFKCHVTDDGTMTEITTDFFDGKCDAFIEGYRFIPDDQSWINVEGFSSSGEMISPWKPYDELNIAQRAYEQEQYAILLAEKHSYTEAYNQGVNEV